MKRRIRGWLLCLLLAAWSGTALAGSQPDERVLWQLFHAGKIALLQQAIRDYQRQYPGWTPSEDLLHALEPPLNGGQSGSNRSMIVQERIGETIRRQDWSGLIRLARTYPAFFTCKRHGHLQVLALAYARSGKMAQAGRHYRRLLGCSGVPVRAVLKEAFWALPMTEFCGLLASARAALPAAVYADFDYLSRRKLLWDAYRQDDREQFGILAGDLAGQAQQRKDLELLKLVAWYWYDKQQWQRAANWFRLGLDLAPDDADLLQGLLTVSIKLQQDQQVVSLAQEYGNRWPQLREEAGGYLLGRAWTFYRQGHFSESREDAQLASAWLADKESAQFLLAWLDLEDENYSRARQQFGELFRKHPENRQYAQALVSSYLRSGDDLDRLARSYPGNQTLARALIPEFSEQSYYRKQFLRAWSQDTQAFPQLENIDSPSLAASGLFRFKSGDSGLGRLHTFIAPLLEGEYPAGVQQFGMRLGFQMLRSGRLGESGIDALQAGDRQFNSDEQQVLEEEARQLRANPPTHRVNAALLEFSYRREGPFNPYASIGLTPVGGPLSPRPTFRLGLGDWLGGRNSPVKLRWNVEGYSQPVRQSLLSYTGWEVLGERWGRVLKSGAAYTGLLQWGRSRWSLYHSLDIAFLDGHRTRNNWMAGLTLAPGYDFHLKGFDYFSLGPYFNYLHYDNNQNHYRLGHGGYFSPQEFYAAGLQLSLLTREGRKFIVEGRLGLGVQTFREARAPWYPQGCGTQQVLCAANPVYTGNRTTDFAPSGRVRFVWQVHPYLQLAGGVYGQSTSGYNEFGAGLSLRWLFASRPAVFSSDLPGYMFGILQ